MAQQGAALQTYNLELVKGVCANIIEVSLSMCSENARELLETASKETLADAEDR
jgi:hypothetical protein